MASAAGSSTTSSAPRASTTTTTAASASSRVIRASTLKQSTPTLLSLVQNPLSSGADATPTLPLQSVSANQGTATKWLDVTLMHDFYSSHSTSGQKARCVMNMFVCRPRRLAQRGEKKLVFPVSILERHPFTPQTFIPLGVGAGDSRVRYLVIVAPTLPSSPSPSQASLPSTKRTSSDRQPPYPLPEPKRKRSLMEKLFGARPNPYTNDHNPSTTPSPSENASPIPPRQGPGMPDLNNLQAFIARGDQAVTYHAGTWHAPMVVLGDKPIEFVVVQYANGVANDDCQEVEITAFDGGDGLAVDVEGWDGDLAVRAKL